MTISEQNIINRWQAMANADLGADIQPLAIQISNFFNEIIGSGTSHNFTDYVEGIVRGYKINNNLDGDDVQVSTLYDLHVIAMTNDCISDFDFYLMENQGWATRYEFIQ